MALSLVQAAVDDRVEITLTGDLDALTAPQFQAELEKAAALKPRRLVLHVKDLAFMASAGIRMLIEKKVDYTKSKNLILTSVVLISGISGAAVKLGTVELKGMALGTFVAIVISLVFELFNRLGWANDSEPSSPGIHVSDETK